MGSSEVRRSAVISALVALTLLLAPVQARQRVALPPATETYGSPTRDQARDWSGDIPARISSITGTVTLEREGKLEPAETNSPLLAGDRLRTRGSSRVEVLFSDGTSVTVDEDSDLAMQSASLMRLFEGQIRFAIVRATTTLDYRVDAAAASIWIRAAGDYRISARPRRSEKPEVILTVLRGSAELVNEHGRSTVRAGQEALATPDLAPSLAYDVNSASTQEFDTWTEDQREARVGSASIDYLPSELRYESGAFDQYGSWGYQAPHGYVWYPRVATAWRPYWQGRWAYTGHFGWFWVGVDRWSWATHHYGRWGVGNAGWYWIPGRSWSPAWVSWGNAPGYIGWCPLGYNGYPVVGFHTSGYYSPWSAWTIVPRTVWAPNIWVTPHVVVPTAVPPVVHARFIEVPVAPVPTVGFHNIEPLRAPTLGHAVARYARPVAPGEEWRERTLRTGSAVPRTNTTMTSASPRDLTDRSGLQTDTAENTAVQRAAPGSSRLADVTNRPASTAIDVPRVEVPMVNTPRVDRSPSRAVPRSFDPTAPQDDGRRSTTDVQRAVPRVDPYAGAYGPSNAGRSTGREPSRVPQVNSSVASSPRSAEPARGGSRAVGRSDSPSGFAPAGIPASPSAGQAPSRLAPSGPPPSSAAPPPAAGARSSGSDSSTSTIGRAVPRAGGGG